MSFQLAELFVDIGLQGWDKLQSELSKVGSALQQVPPLKIATPDVAGAVQKNIAQLPSAVPVKITSDATQLAKVKTVVDSIPNQKTIKTTATATGLDKIAADLNKIPKSLTVNAKGDPAGLKPIPDALAKVPKSLTVHAQGDATGLKPIPEQLAKIPKTLTVQAVGETSKLQAIPDALAKVPKSLTVTAQGDPTGLKAIPEAVQKLPKTLTVATQADTKGLTAIPETLAKIPRLLSVQANGDVTGLRTIPETLAKVPKSVSVQATADTRGLSALGDSIAKLPRTLQIKTLLDQTEAFGKLKSSLDAQPLALKLKLDDDRSTYFTKLKQDLASQPASVRVQVVAEKLEAVNREIERLSAKPKTARIEARLEMLQKVKDDLASIKAPPLRQTLLLDKTEALKGLKDSLNLTPATLALKLQADQKEFVAGLRKDLAGLPTHVRVQVVADKLAEVQKQIDDLTKQPRTAKVQAKLDVLQDAKKQLEGLRVPSLGEKLAGGLGVVQKATAGLQQGLDKVMNGLNQVGQVATKAFAGATAAVLGLVRVASPGHFQLFTDSLTVLGKEVGKVFIPIVQELTRVIVNIASWFRGLDNETKNQILGWTKFGIVMAGILAIGPKLVGMFKLVVMGFAGMLSGIQALLASNPAGWVTMLVGGIAALLAAIAAVGGAFLIAGQKGKTWEDKLASLWQGIQRFWQMLEPITSAIMEAMEEMGAAFTAAAEEINEVWKDAGVDLSQVFELFKDAVLLLVKISTEQFIVFTKALVVLHTVAVAIFKELVKAWHWVSEQFRAIAQGIGGPLENAFEGIKDAWESFTNAMVEGVKFLMKSFLALQAIASEVMQGVSRASALAIQSAVDPLGTAKRIASGELKASIDDIAKSIDPKVLGQKVAEAYAAYEKELKATKKAIEAQGGQVGQAGGLPEEKKNLLQTFTSALGLDQLQDEIKKNLDKFDLRLEQKRDEMKRDGEKATPTPMRERQAPILSSIADAWRRIQTSQAEPSLDQLKKQTMTQQQMLDQLERIAANTGTKQPAFAGAAL